MRFNRRRFISGLAGASALAVLPSLSLAQVDAMRVRAVVFDAFPIFDPRPIFLLTEELFPGHGQALSDLWRTRQFEYTWLRTLSHRYVDFKTVTTDALTFAARSLKLPLNGQQQAALINAYSTLDAWPDVVEALTTLHGAGIRLGFLSNFTRQMLVANLRHTGLSPFFEHVLSTDEAGAFKPDPRAYQLGPEAFALRREEIVFAAFAGWDAAGAKLFGYPTFWVNRQSAPTENLDAGPDASGSMADLVQFVMQRHSSF
jgi:2-haloacid dehalogenase